MSVMPDVLVELHIINWLRERLPINRHVIVAGVTNQLTNLRYLMTDRFET